MLSQAVDVGTISAAYSMNGLEWTTLIDTEGNKQVYKYILVYIYIIIHFYLTLVLKPMFCIYKMLNIYIMLNFQEFNVQVDIGSFAIVTTFDPSFLARYFRVFVETWLTVPCLRLELYGITQGILIHSLFF